MAKFIEYKKGRFTNLDLFTKIKITEEEGRGVMVSLYLGRKAVKITLDKTKDAEVITKIENYLNDNKL